MTIEAVGQQGTGCMHDVERSAPLAQMGATDEHAAFDPFADEDQGAFAYGHEEDNAVDIYASDCFRRTLMANLGRRVPDGKSFEDFTADEKELVCMVIALGNDPTPEVVSEADKMLSGVLRREAQAERTEQLRNEQISMTSRGTVTERNLREAQRTLRTLQTIGDTVTARIVQRHIDELGVSVATDAAA